MPDTAHDHKTLEPFHGPVPSPPDPVQVEIVGLTDVKVKPERDWQPVVALCNNGAEACRIVGKNNRRRALVIVNGGSTIYLIPDRQGNTTTGVPVAPGAQITMEHQGAVYFLAPGATQAAPAIVNGWSEYEAAGQHP